MKAVPISHSQEYLMRRCAEKINSEVFTKPYTSIGFSLDQEIIGGVTFSHFNGREIWASIWADNKKMFTRTNLRTMFEYPFLICGVQRLSSVVRRDNEKSLKLTRQLGFIEEGVTRHCFENTSDGDGIRFGMLPAECKWIPKEIGHG